MLTFPSQKNKSSSSILESYWLDWNQL